MIFLIINILTSFFNLSDSSFDVSLDNYIKEHFNECSHVEYSYVSQQSDDLFLYEIDESRELKRNGAYAYIPVRELTTDGNSKNSILTIKLKIFKNVLVANRDIGLNEILTLSDFRNDEKDISELRFSPVEIGTSLESYQSKLRIDENSILQMGMLERIPDVRIGDRVRAIFTNNSVSISFSVTARSQGISGNIIKVKRDDNKIFRARIINNNTVKIIE